MNQEQVLSLIRQILTMAGSALVAKGLVDQTTLVTAVGAIATLGSVVWSMIHHKGTPPTTPPAA